MGTRLVASWAGILAVAMVFVGCGGGDDSSTNANAISKAEFIRKADAICQGGNKRMELGFAAFLKENKNITRPTDADYEKLVVEVLVPNFRKEVSEIRALGAPSGDEDRVDDILEALEEGLETAEDDPALAVTSSDAVFGISSRLAREYGLDVCGSR